MRRSLFLSLLAAIVVAPAPVVAQEAPVVVYVVRHAERADEGAVRNMWDGDPPLSTAGTERAHLLAELLRDAGITRIHTTDFVRTRATVQPLADQEGLEPVTYDANDLANLARRLEQMPGRHLVVGHSNTTPELVRRLGGDPRGPIASLEYDRLYIVTLTPDGASTVLLRFGDRFRS